jgi:hypothetical protein
MMSAGAVSPWTVCISRKEMRRRVVSSQSTRRTHARLFDVPVRSLLAAGQQAAIPVEIVDQIREQLADERWNFAPAMGGRERAIRIFSWIKNPQNGE